MRILVIAILCLCAALGQAAEGLPGAEQFKQQFQQMSPEQRQAAVRALGAQPEPAVAVEMPAPLQTESVPPAPDGRVETGALRLRAGDTLLLGLQTPPASPDRLPATEKRLYLLDHARAIVLPDAGRIMLAGLSEREAVERLSVEPALAGRVVSLQLLPVEPELRQFGLDLFRSAPSTFAPAGNIPVPADYVIGPGDSVIVQLFGKDNSLHELTVTRDGALLFPASACCRSRGSAFPGCRTRYRVACSASSAA
ncbi:MAG: polysaccharide biosynthesis/export family protein [Gammaproteobacteria bacterium]|nr:polysaccharide biosynthesis/export family protein [Gammaproteobacteria bacterium]